LQLFHFGLRVVSFWFAGRLILVCHCLAHSESGLQLFHCGLQVVSLWFATVWPTVNPLVTELAMPTRDHHSPEKPHAIEFLADSQQPKDCGE
jgi:hypothetical protein